MNTKWTWSDDITWAIEAEAAAGFVDDEPDEMMRSRKRILRVGYGINLAMVVASEAVPFDMLIAHGLPRGDLFAELAMLHRLDCPADFFRGSQFYKQVLASPSLPPEVAQTLLASDPTALEAEVLANHVESNHPDESL